MDNAKYINADIENIMNPMSNYITMGDLSTKQLDTIIAAAEKFGDLEIFQILIDNIQNQEILQNIIPSRDYSRYRKRNMNVENYFKYIRDKYPDLKVIYIIYFYKLKSCSRPAAQIMECVINECYWVIKTIQLLLYYIPSFAQQPWDKPQPTVRSVPSQSIAKLPSNSEINSQCWNPSIINKFVVPTQTIGKLPQ